VIRTDLSSRYTTEELEDSDKERPSAFPKIVLKQTNSGIQQLYGTSERTQDQQGGRPCL
jgi:hypothetical protein